MRTGARPDAHGCCGTMMVLGAASSNFSRSIGRWNGFRSEVHFPFGGIVGMDEIRAFK